MASFHKTVVYFKDIIKQDKKVRDDARASVVVTFLPAEKKSPESLVERLETVVPQIIIRVVDQDCLDVAWEILHEYKSTPLVLNMASAFKPGGGWEKGSMAQEESIFL